MDFTTTALIAHPPAVVQDAMLDPEFLAVTGTLPKIGGAEVLERTRTDTTANLRVRYRFTAPLSRAVTAVVDPQKLTWVDDGRFDLRTMRSQHELQPDNYADRLQSTYASDLAPEGAGTRWTVTGSLVVHAPLVGNKVAAVIIDGLRDHTLAEAAVLDDWLTQQG
jgi:hypothetical protein